MRALLRTLQSGVVFATLTSGILSGCKNDVSANESVHVAAPSIGSTSAVVTVKEGQAQYDEAAFGLELVALQPITVGKSGSFVVTLSAKPPFHVNAEYPHRFKVSSTKGGSAPSSTVTRDSAKVSPTKLELVVPVVPTQPGSFELEGEMSFSVCTEDRCLMEKRQLKAVFQAT